MSWREDLRPASFRGVPFHVEAHDLTGGRRLALHQFPLRDEPYAEDLGRQGRNQNVDAYVVGDDYMAARDKLIAALEKAGPGSLVHPYLGTMQMAVRSYRLRESTRDGGIARFAIAFVEAGAAAFPSAAADTAGQCQLAADTLLETAAEDFKSWWNVDGLPQPVIAELEAELDRTLDGVTRLVGHIAGPIAAEIRAPANMAAALIGAVAQVAAVAGSPLQAARLYESLFSAGSRSAPVPTNTPTRRRQARSVNALHQLTRRAAVAEASRQSARAEFTARADALAQRTTLTAALDAQSAATDPVSGAPIADAVYQAMADLRAAVAEDLRIRGARLPELTRYTPPGTLPALVVAHRLYGDATREGEIVNRNRIRHPGFVGGGQGLEVLNA